MPKFFKPTGKVRGQFPLSIKLGFFLALMIGLWVRSCVRTSELENIVFDTIMIENQTHLSCEVLFTIHNKTFQKGRKKVLIEVYTDKNELISNKLAVIILEPNSVKQYVQILERFHRPLREGESIEFAVISLYQRPFY